MLIDTIFSTFLVKHWLCPAWDWIQATWIQSVTFKLQVTKFSVICANMEKARGGSSQGAGRPQNEGATQSKVTVFLGRDEEARELKSKRAAPWVEPERLATRHR